MQAPRETLDLAALDALVASAGERVWAERLRAVQQRCGAASRAGRAAHQAHALELVIERLRRGGGGGSSRVPTAAEQRVLALVGEFARMAASLPRRGKDRLRASLVAGLTDGGTLVPLFHLLRTALLQRTRGFEVEYTGFLHGTSHDLLIHRDGSEAEVACDVMSAEEGRGVHRGAWFNLVDRVDPELQTWLAAHPGRYVLKLTLPQGLKAGSPDGPAALAVLHQRITALLAQQRRADWDEAAVLRLDPLLLAGAQAPDAGLLGKLRQEFGPEAHLSVTAAGGGVFVMAARAGQENEIAVALRRRLAALAPARLSGTRPGVLAVFIEDIDRIEWRGLRERLELEGEARQFLTYPEARTVVAVACSSRVEMFGSAETDAAPDGELRFRNPAHPASRIAALAPAVLSSV